MKHKDLAKFIGRFKVIALLPTKGRSRNEVSNALSKQAD